MTAHSVETSGRTTAPRSGLDSWRRHRGRPVRHPTEPRIRNTPTTLAADIRPGGEPRERATGTLWVALAVCVGLNAVFSILKPDDVLFSLVFGIPAVLCLVMLVARYLGRRRS